MSNTPTPLVKPKKGKKTDLLINNIVIRQPYRGTADIGNWRNALIGAEGILGHRVRLYDLYNDILLDNVLSDALDKRITNITNSNIIFQVNGKSNDVMDELMESDDFELLITEIINTKFWGITVLEFDFSNGMKVYNIPRKHINPRRGEILINQWDTAGIPYRDDPFFMEVGKKDDLGLILKASPYVIYKRGSFGDWAQYAEVFGMPFRKGSYNSYDEYTRKQLEEALEKSGSAPWVVIPKEGDIEYLESRSVASDGGIYDKLRAACNEEILIGILGQTMTTLHGSSKSQSQTHKESEEGIQRSDCRYLERILNRRFLPILEMRGYPVKGGRFIIPESEENVLMKDRIDIDTKLNNLVDIDEEYFYDTYGIPKPKGKIARKAVNPLGVPPPESDHSAAEMKGKFKRFLRFF